MDEDATLWVILPVKESEEFIGSALRMPATTSSPWALLSGQGISS
jgi:hypothetical protein